jgi:LacI family transcriptional regulator
MTVPATIADVASRAGVSKTTVSRVLNNRGELHEATIRKVRDAISELGYVPSAGAVGLARGRTQLIGMLVPSLTWPWIGAVLEGAVQVLEGEGFGMRLLTFDHGEEALRRLGVQVAAKSFDGLLVITPEGSLDYLTELHAAGLPVVLIDDHAHRPLFPHVATTNRAGGGDAARHLLELGRRRPLVVAGPLNYGCVQERHAGFDEVCVEAGITLSDEDVVDGRFTFDGGRDQVRRVVAAGKKFDAIFAHNDQSAAGALVALREAGLRVPQDVAVVGFDDVELAAYTDPALTTVAQPLREMGATAASLLLEHVRESPPSENSRTLATRLVIRGSTQGPDQS